MKLTNLKYLNIALVIMFSFIIYSSNGCKDVTKIQPDRKPINDVKVKIITFVSHEVMDAIVFSTKKYLVDSLKLNISNIEVFNPNGKKEEIATYIKRLNSSNTDIIVSISTPATLAVLANRHPSLPVIYSFVSDSSALDLSKEKNVSGISNVLDYEKGFELFKKILPNAKTIGVIYNPNEPNSLFSFTQISKTAEIQNPKINVVSGQFTKSEEIPIIASSLSNIDAFFVGGDNKLVANFDALYSVAKLKKIPVFASDEGSVKKGAIAAYSIDYNLFGIETAKLIQERINSNENFRRFVLYSTGREVSNNENK